MAKQKQMFLIFFNGVIPQNLDNAIYIQLSLHFFSAKEKQKGITKGLQV